MITKSPFTIAEGEDMQKVDFKCSLPPSVICDLDEDCTIKV